MKAPILRTALCMNRFQHVPKSIFDPDSQSCIQIYRAVQILTLEVDAWTGGNRSALKCPYFGCLNCLKTVRMDHKSGKRKRRIGTPGLRLLNACFQFIDNFFTLTNV